MRESENSSTRSLTLIQILMRLNQRRVLTPRAMLYLSWQSMMLLYVIVLDSTQLIFHLAVINATGMNEFVLLGQAGLK